MKRASISPGECSAHWPSRPGVPAPRPLEGFALQSLMPGGHKVRLRPEHADRASDANHDVSNRPAQTDANENEDNDDNVSRDTLSEECPSVTGSRDRRTRTRPTPRRFLVVFSGDSFLLECRSAPFRESRRRQRPPHSSRFLTPLERTRLARQRRRSRPPQRRHLDPTAHLRSKIETAAPSSAPWTASKRPPVGS